MKVTWKKKTPSKIERDISRRFPHLPFDDNQSDVPSSTPTPSTSYNGQTLGENSITTTSTPHPSSDTASSMADFFSEQGNRLAEEGRYHEALGKWETAITLMPDKTVVHEQKAQVLLEIGDAWAALKAATRATELDPSWADGWITLGRAQLNFGEPDVAIESFDKALALNPTVSDAQTDRQVAVHLVKRRKELHSSGNSVNARRYMVGDKQWSPSAAGPSFLRMETEMTWVKATFQLASETHTIEVKNGPLLSEQLVSMKEKSMGILKEFITKHNVPADVPDEPLDGSSGEEEAEDSFINATAKSKKRK